MRSTCLKVMDTDNCAQYEPLALEWDSINDLVTLWCKHELYVLNECACRNAGTRIYSLLKLSPMINEAASNLPCTGTIMPIFCITYVAYLGRLRSFIVRCIIKARIKRRGIRLSPVRREAPGSAGPCWSPGGAATPCRPRPRGWGPGSAFKLLFTQNLNGSRKCSKIRYLAWLSPGPSH